MKILITGATGFLGSHLTHFLAKQNHQIFVLVRSEKKFQKLGLPATPIIGSLSANSVNEWTRELPYDLDAVVHTAGIVHSFNPRDFYDINARATKQLIEDLAKMFPLNLRFCLISSLSGAGPSQKRRPRLEDDVPQPVSHYGHSKHLAELFFTQFAPMTWKKTIIRPPIIIGPNDEAFLDLFMMVKKGIILIPGFKGLHKEYSFVCVFDLIEAIAQSLQINQKKNTPEIYFVAHPRPFTFGELISRITNLIEAVPKLRIILPFFFILTLAVLNKILHHFNPHYNFRLTPDKAMELRCDSWVVSSNKADEILALNYKWNLEQTLKVTYEDYKLAKKI